MKDTEQLEWTDAAIPTDILSFLKKEKVVSDPYIGTSDLGCRWVEDLDWLFRCRFISPPEFAQSDSIVTLVLDNIDCYAEVFFNQVRLGHTENQFHEYRFTLDEILPDFENELLIYIRSAKEVTTVLERAHGELPSGFDTARVHARRCQCLTGWDWAARLSSAAVLSPPRLELERPFELAAPCLYVREITPVEFGARATPLAVLNAEVDITAHRRAKGRVHLRILNDAGELVGSGETAVRLGIGETRARLTVKVPDARLWWPLGCGETPLYTAAFELEGQDRTGHPVSAQAESSFGMRTVAIDRKKDAEGESFIPLINGHPIFCRGANWIPVSMLPSENRDNDYRLLLNAAAAAGMNCLRIWGGGIYENELFYSTCDRLGILVWQDFMFACAAYPTYREFLDEVGQEAEYQIKRLRNHPSIFLWCGNNENEWLHQIGELRKGNERRIIGEEIWSSLLRARCEDLDPSRPYHQSSPFGKNRDDYNDPQSGDRHNWDCWARWQSYETYLSDTGRFLSEFGFQSIPERASLERFAPGADSMNNPLILHHQKMVHGQERLARYAAEMFYLPSHFNDWIDVTQRLQSEILRRAVEHWRRRKFMTAGTLIWQLHDAYPALSWSLIDFYRRPKPAYHAARRFFAPVLLSVGLEADGREVGAFEPKTEVPMPTQYPVPVGGTDRACPVAIHRRGIVIVLINDTAHALRGTLRIIRRAGAEEHEAAVVDLSVSADSNSEPLRFLLSELGVEDIRSECLSAVFEPDGDSLQALSHVYGETTRRLQELPIPGSDESFHSMDFAQGLQADVLLVEPKYFHWPDGLRIFGRGRPSWHPVPENSSQI